MTKKKLLYKRILLKLSGETLKGERAYGYDAAAVAQVAAKVKELLTLGVEAALVVGAGNLWRGLAGAKHGMDRVTADRMGMLATVMNALCLRDAFAGSGVESSVHSAVAMEPFAKGFDRERALRELADGKVVIFAAGLGSPYFTTDTAAALRALETRCQALVKATKVNGIYSADPVTHPKAKKFASLTFRQAVKGHYGIMDPAAFALCADNDLHIIVCNFAEPGALAKILSGDYSAGTVVH